MKHIPVKFKLANYISLRFEKKPFKPAVWRHGKCVSHATPGSKAVKGKCLKQLKTRIFAASAELEAESDFRRLSKKLETLLDRMEVIRIAGYVRAGSGMGRHALHSNRQLPPWSEWMCHRSVDHNRSAE